jgi:hypothetical protein
MIKFTVGEDTYEFDDTAMTIDEARLIKKNAGMGMKSWALAMADMDPDALVGLIYLAKVRAGEAVRWSDLYSIKFSDIDLIDDGDDAVPPALKISRASTSGRTRKQ